MKTLIQTLLIFLLVTQMCFAQWIQTGLQGVNVICLAISDTNLFAGTLDLNGGDGVFLSTNDGTTWTQVNTGLTNTNVRTLAVSGTNLFAGTIGDGVFLSTNNGTNWIPVNTGLTNTSVFSLAVSGTNLFAGTGGGVFLSTNNGTSWTASGLDSYVVLAFAVLDTNLFAAIFGDGVFLSTNNGTNWIPVNTGLNPNVRTLAVSGTNLFAGTDGGIFLSTNNGTNWIPVNTGLTNTSVFSLAVSDTNLFAGTGFDGVWKRALSELITIVESTPAVPTTFCLEQNYPNPFNPRTKIKYSVPDFSQVQIKVFDILGNEIETLVNEEKHAGSYELTWNVANLPSGIYFYQLKSRDFIQTKKMLLLK